MVSFRGQIKLESCPVCSPLSASLTLTSDGTSRVSSYFTLETASTFLCRMKTKHRIGTRKFITSDRALPIKALDRSRLTVILNTILLDVNTLFYKRFFFCALKSKTLSLYALEVLRNTYSYMYTLLLSTSSSHGPYKEIFAEVIVRTLQCV